MHTVYTQYHTLASGVRGHSSKASEFNPSIIHTQVEVQEEQTNPEFLLAVLLFALV